jgi:PTS system mannose-specific IIA component
VSETKATVGVVVVTHGLLGRELVEAARVILGGDDRLPLQALSIGWDDPMDEARALVDEALASADRGSGVLILTDMFGGTPTNLCLSFLAEDEVEIITGVNLPMVVKCMNLGAELGAGRTLREVAERVARKGSSSIVLASEMLEG